VSYIRRASVRLSHQWQAADAGLLLCARRAGDIDRLLHGRRSATAARRAAANAGSVMLTADVRPTISFRPNQRLFRVPQGRLLLTYAAWTTSDLISTDLVLAVSQSFVAHLMHSLASPLRSLNALAFQPRVERVVARHTLLLVRLPPSRRLRRLRLGAPRLLTLQCALLLVCQPVSRPAINSAIGVLLTLTRSQPFHVIDCE